MIPVYNYTLRTSYSCCNNYILITNSLRKNSLQLLISVLNFYRFNFNFSYFKLMSKFNHFVL